MKLECITLLLSKRELDILTMAIELTEAEARLIKTLLQNEIVKLKQILANILGCTGEYAVMWAKGEFN